VTGEKLTGKEMARQDIQADPVYGDLETTDKLAGKAVHDFLLLENPAGEDSENYCYGEISVPSGFESKFDAGDSIYVQIPYIPVFKELRIRFSIETGNGSTEYLLNRTDNRIWFPVFLAGETGGILPVCLSGFHELNENGIFCLLPQNGYLLLFSGDETDLEIRPALAQNEVFLLKAMAGNLYQHPATGVGLVEFLHGNFENSKLAQKLQQEFEDDNMIINSAYMDSITGELLLDVKEKNG
jgi:hypothetical protein